MKKIVMFAAIAALTTLAACSDKPAPADPANTTVVESPKAEKTGGPCGDGRVLREHEVCP